MAKKSTFAMAIDWGHSFMLKSIKNALSKSRFWRIMGGGGGVHAHLLYMSDYNRILPWACNIQVEVEFIKIEIYLCVKKVICDWDQFH